MHLPSPFARLKLRHLRCFLAVAQLKSLRKAAERLSISQPAVTKTLGELEDISGKHLLVRARGGAELTEAGRLFLPFAQAALANLAEGLGALAADAPSSAPLVRVGTLPTVASVLLPDALASFRRDWPTAQVQVVTERNSGLLEHLRAGLIDFALARLAEPQAMEGMVFEHLFREPMEAVVRAGHPLAQEAVLTISQLERYPIIVPPDGTLIRQSADSMLASLKGSARYGRIESLSNSLNAVLTFESDAVWFAPHSLVEREVKQGRLLRLKLPFAGTDEPVGLIRMSGATLSDASNALIGCVRHAGLAREARRQSPDVGSN